MKPFILYKIDAERVRQEELRLAGKFRFTCADPTESNSIKLPVLMEEVGEVAKAINERDKAELKKELIQTAAVCVAWLEALE